MHAQSHSNLPRRGMSAFWGYAYIKDNSEGKMNCVLRKQKCFSKIQVSKLQRKIASKTTTVA